MALIEDIMSGKEILRIQNKIEKWDFAKKINTDLIVLVEGFKKSGNIALCIHRNNECKNLIEHINIDDLEKIDIVIGDSVSYRKGSKKELLMKVKAVKKGKAFCFWKEKSKIVSEWVPVENLRWTDKCRFDLGDQVELISQRHEENSKSMRVSAICEYQLYITCIDAIEDTFASFSPPTLYYFEDLYKY